MSITLFKDLLPKTVVSFRILIISLAYISLLTLVFVFLALDSSADSLNCFSVVYWVVSAGTIMSGTATPIVAAPVFSITLPI